MAITQPDPELALPCFRRKHLVNHGDKVSGTHTVPVFSDLVSLQYVRPEVSGEILFGNSDLATLHPAGHDRYANRADIYASGNGWV